MLTRELILQAADLAAETVSVPEWGGEVRVRVMTGFERDTWEMELLTAREKNLARVRATLCALTVVDEQGARLFTHADIEALGGKSAAALDRVFEAAKRLNRIGAADVEDLRKNS